MELWEKQGQDGDSIRAWVHLNLIENVGAVTFRRLVDYFGSPGEALEAPQHHLAKVAGIGEKKAQQIARQREKVDPDEEIELAEKMGVRLIPFNSAEYPLLLKKIHDPPALLYVKGTLCEQDNLAISIVGSRRCSFYGREQASRFAHLLASAGITVVSGLARGIDTAAHEGALSGQGRTLAVQGRGLADVYPTENRDLAKKICHQGAMLSEFPLRYEPFKNLFPQRNRIIAGLSLGTLIVEAQQRSGALITARLAMESEREVMAIPGNIDAPNSGGTNRLIKDGATLVDSVEDIMQTLEYIGVDFKRQVTEKSKAAERKAESGGGHGQRLELKLPPVEQSVYAGLPREATHIEQIIENTPHTPAQLNAALLNLQLKGLVKQLPGQFYQRT